MANINPKLFTNFVLIVTSLFIFYQLITTDYNQCKCICCTESVRYIDRYDFVQHMCFNETILYAQEKCMIIGYFSLQTKQLIAVAINIMFLIIVNKEDFNTPRINREYIYVILCGMSVIIFTLLAIISQNPNCRKFGDEYNHCLEYTRHPN